MKIQQLKYTLIVLAAFLFIQGKGQQFPVYSQYWTNKFLLNPAVAGHEGYTAFNLTARKQWANLKGSPGTLAVSGQTRLVRSSHISRGKNVVKRRKAMTRGGKVGVGGYIFTDNLGAFNKTGFQGTYAYHIGMNESQLSFGASLIGLQYHLDKDKMSVENPDYLLDITSTNGYVIDGNFGSYYSAEDYYGGFAVHNLFESFFKLNNRDGSDVKLERQYMLMGGYRYEVDRALFLEPSFNFKFSENVASQLDLNLTAYFNENYWAGIAYRTGGGSSVSSESMKGRGAAIILYGGLRVEKFFFGYSFDYSLSSIQKYSYGSHEIFAGVRFGDNARRYRWLNRY